MKPNSTLALAFLLTVAITSCQKEQSVDTGGANAKNKIKTYTEDVTYPGLGHIVETFNVNYDNQDRVISLVSTTTPSSRFEYNYGSDRFDLDIYAAGVLTIHNTFYLNSSRTLVDSAMQYNNTNDTMLTKYVYNAGNKLVQQREYDYTKQTGPQLYNTIDYTYDGNGVIIKEEDDFTSTTYTYDKVIKNSITVGAPYMPLPIQLPTQTSTTDGVDTETTDYTYTFDDKNRLTSEKGVSNSGLILIRSYTYY